MSAMPEAKKAETENLDATKSATAADGAGAESNVIATDHVEAEPQFAEILQKVTAETGKGYGALMRDMFRYCLGRNKLTTEEYLNLRLYDDAYTSEEKAAFVGIAKSRNIWTRKIDRAIGHIAAVDRHRTDALIEVGWFSEKPATGMDGKETLKSGNGFKACYPWQITAEIAGCQGSHNRKSGAAEQGFTG